jgi:hypothetical protein
MSFTTLTFYPMLRTEEEVLKIARLFARGYCVEHPCTNADPTAEEGAYQLFLDAYLHALKDALQLPAWAIPLGWEPLNEQDALTAMPTAYQEPIPEYDANLPLNKRKGYVALRASSNYPDGTARLLTEISNTGRTEPDMKAMADCLRLIFTKPSRALWLLKPAYSLGFLR